VLHARHSTFYLFYARFPSLYLQEIVKYGVEYRHRVEHPQEIILKQSRAYRMHKPSDQSAFFHLLMRLLTYLKSGQSHVDFLYNHKGNPFVSQPVYALSSSLLMIGTSYSRLCCRCAVREKATGG
jgi:hypothetical protein